MINKALSRGLRRRDKLVIVRLGQHDNCGFPAPGHVLRPARQCVGNNGAKAVLGILKVPHGPIFCLVR